MSPTSIPAHPSASAVEEAVVNAIYHRSYDIREPIEVQITREELVALSFPGPDRSLLGGPARRHRRQPPLPRMNADERG
jgi:predicted HTH transcriptional regulator